MGRRSPALAAVDDVPERAGPARHGRRGKNTQSCAGFSVAQRTRLARERSRAAHQGTVIAPSTEWRFHGGLRSLCDFAMDNTLPQRAGMEMVQPAAVQIKAERALIEGDLAIPIKSNGLVVFAHGSGSSRFSRRNQFVAHVLQDGGYATLLLDLLTSNEEAIDNETREYRFDVDRLGHRVISAIDWAASQQRVARLSVACFGASTGAAAALIAAAERPQLVRAVISRGGRPDLAGFALPKVQAPTLLIVGGDDEPVIALNRAAMRRMRAPVQLEIVPGATHLFQEPGALESVSRLALQWCTKYVKGSTN